MFVIVMFSIVFTLNMMHIFGRKNNKNFNGLKKKHQNCYFFDILGNEQTLLII